MLEIDNLSFEYEGRIVLNNINLQIASGEICVIQGKNGSGKSTLLKILAGLYRPSSGLLLVSGINAHDSMNAYRHDFSYLGFELPLDQRMTVFQILKFWGLAANSQILIDSALTCLDLMDLKNIQISKLSSGFQRRVAFCKLILDRTKLWLLDEPFVSLDEIATDILINLIKTNANCGGIVVFSTNQNVQNLKASKMLALDKRISGLE